MIRNNLAYLQYRRGIPSTKALARMAESTPRAIRALKNHQTKAISMDLLERLCVVLECQVGDLLVNDPGFKPPTWEIEI